MVMTEHARPVAAREAPMVHAQEDGTPEYFLDANPYVTVFLARLIRQATLIAITLCARRITRHHQAITRGRCAGQRTCFPCRGCGPQARGRRHMPLRGVSKGGKRARKTGSSERAEQM